MKLDDEKDHMARDDEQKIKMKEDKAVIQKEKEKKDCLRSKVVVPTKNEAKNPPEQKLMCHRRKQNWYYNQSCWVPDPIHNMGQGGAGSCSMDSASSSQLSSSPVSATAAGEALKEGCSGMLFSLATWSEVRVAPADEEVRACHLQVSEWTEWGHRTDRGLGRKIHGQWDSEEATKWKKASLALELFMVWQMNPKATLKAD